MNATPLPLGKYKTRDGRDAEVSAETLFNTGWEVSLDRGETWSFFGKDGGPK